MERGRLVRILVCGRLVRLEHRKMPLFHKGGGTPATPVRTRRPRSFSKICKSDKLKDENFISHFTFLISPL